MLTDALRLPHHVLVTGGTGFVGSRLVEASIAGGHRVSVLTRNPARAARLPDTVKVVTSLDQIAAAERIDAVVNLAGEPISDSPWTRRKRARIIASRVDATRACLDLIARLDVKPGVLISGSAIGWYGIRDDAELDESSPGTACFSREVCTRWETAAAGAGVRTILLRTGLVLGQGGGLLARMLPAFRLGLGGRFGSGRHWMSWIHQDDLVRLIVHCIADPAVAGPVNATAPNPVSNRDFTRALGRALNRPTILPVPAWPLTALLGDFARELLLGGQRVLPRAAEASGFVFHYPEIDGALAAITRADHPRR